MIDDELQRAARDMAELRRLLETIAATAERINSDLHELRSDTRLKDELRTVLKGELESLDNLAEPNFARIEQRFDKIDAILTDIKRGLAAGGEGRKS